MATIADYPSPNFGYPRGGHGRNQRKIAALVIHIMDGTLGSTRSWFANPDSQASSTYGVGRAGELDRYVQEADSPWTNGDIQGPDLSIPWLHDCIEQGINPNEVTETLECEGHPNEPWPEAQYQAVLARVKERLAANGLVAGPNTVIGHYRINSVTRPNCPGPNFPWARLFHDLAVSANLGPRTKSLVLKDMWAKMRAACANAGAPDPLGLMQHEATADLTGILPSLPSAAQCLVCEKGVLWVGGAGQPDTFHRQQFEALVAAGKAQEWK